MILPRQVAYFKYASADLAASRAFITILVANAQKWASEGWGGYIEPGAVRLFHAVGPGFGS